MRFFSRLFRRSRKPARTRTAIRPPELPAGDEFFDVANAELELAVLIHDRVLPGLNMDVSRLVAKRMLADPGGMIVLDSGGVIAPIGICHRLMSALRPPRS